MIPSILSQQIHQGLKDFLSTTFHSTNPFFHDMLERFLDEDGPLRKGPYISLQLPFQKGQDKEFFPHIPLGHTPYLHQELAFSRLSGSEPKPTLIATGTGSGKTECFTWPILEYCRTASSRSGIKAILLYPMNALAYDQAGRLAETIWKTPGLQGKVTAGLFVGQASAEPCPTMRQDSIITDKDILRQNPPDILLTNYKMLDYLLVRARDSILWEKNGPETLRFVVVDELHTFDGAQGTDLACLLRRLKARLGTPKGHLCPIGTSATLGGEGTGERLLAYAEQVFGEAFTPDSIISENRQSVDEFIHSQALDEAALPLPGPEQAEALSPDQYQDAKAYLRAQILLWTGMDVNEPASAGDAEWPVTLGTRLRAHLGIKNLLSIVNGKVRSAQYVLSELSRTFPELGRASKTYQRDFLNSLLACISTARARENQGENEQAAPFIHLRVQGWYRELKRMVCSVEHNPQLAFADDLTEEQRRHHLPILHCRECGQTGWIARKPLHGNTIQTDLQAIYLDFFKAKPSEYLVAFFPLKDVEQPSSFPGHLLGLCPRCLRLGRRSEGRCEGCAQSELIPVLTPEATSKHCPSCGAHKSLTLLGSQSASLTSVMIGQLMASTYNNDPKCITFSDNVQDAAHRAGFFAARTFRFTFRAALQQFVLEQAKGRTLTQVADGLPAYWQERLDPATFAATFLPPNLTWLQEVDYLETHDRLPPDSDLCQVIARRLRFEVVSEYGFSSRIGRTLEKSGASVLRPAAARLQEAASALQESVPNEMEELRNHSLQGLAGFLLGLLTHIKNKGGIFDPELKGYIGQWGKEYLLSQKHKYWMPSFGPQTRTPGFVTTKANVDRFESLTKSGNSSSWPEWWAYQHYPILAMRRPSPAQRFFGLVFAALESTGLIRDQFQDGHHVFGLDPDGFEVVSEVLQVQCSHCGHILSGAVADEPIWSGMSCLRQGCRGRYASTDQGLDYYGRLYSHGELNRLVAAEHTGLLDREKRELLEQRFKAASDRRKPWYPNLLSSTPTLEMGIDIGDLSTTLQCSVPPSQANYIQRVGRSGRKDGNGLNLTVAAGQAHDLYFFTNPLEMLDGAIQSPGVFLDASAVLERQFFAYCLDHWVRDKQGQTPVPQRLGTVLDTFTREDPSVFPHNFIAFIAGRQSDLFQGFLALFSGELSQDSINHLERFVFGDAEETPGVNHRILQRLYDLHKERRGLKTQVDRLYREMKRRENSPARDKNYEHEIEELRQERSGLMSLIKNMNAKDTYNFFTDEGLLPNYAFPEQGILLQSIIFRKRRQVREGQKATETLNFEYERPAGSGLRELAPGNRFYAEGRRVEVDQVDLKVARIEQWRLCAACPHTEPEVTAKNSSLCPRCGSPLWNDQSRRQDLVRLRQVIANAPDRDTRITDESDERSPSFYTTQLLVDVDASAVIDAYQTDVAECPFGFEFLSKAHFRDINFGPMGLNAEQIAVAGKELERPGFIICNKCGKVQKGKKGIRHAFGCPARDKESDKNFVQSVFLYREFTSEAIKILLPVTGLEGSERRLNSFVAALQLGLKHHFGGSAYAIDHLQTTLSNEPVTDSALSKQYLVLFDTVPGGTGFLKQLMRSETMLTVLEKALTVLQTCRCQKEPDRDGCYNCLFAYRNSYTMATTSRETAMEMLSLILSYRDTLKQVNNLQNVRVEGLLDSELEALFLEGIKRFKQQGFSLELRKEVVRGKPGNFLRLGEQAYEIEPQVELGLRDGVAVPSRADFVFWPSRSRAEVKPIAVFTDGLTFHRNRLGQDTAQRMAILAGGRFHVWSLTWKDVQAQVRNQSERIADLLHPGDSRLGRNSFAQLLSKLGLEGCREWHTRDNFTFLMQYLQSPNQKTMQRYALAQAVSLLDMNGSRDREKRAAWLEEMNQWDTGFVLQEVRAHQQDGLIGGLESGPVRVFALGRPQALRTADVQGVSAVCCLDDGESALERVDFERSWINALRLYNIFQFLPGARFITRQGVAKGAYFALQWETADQESSTDKEKAQSVDPAWKEIWELADPEVHSVLEQLQQQGRPAPEVGFELIVNGRVEAEAELAWPNDKEVYLTAEQIDMKDFFQEQGWSVHSV